jgi:hypothetical protein
MPCTLITLGEEREDKGYYKEEPARKSRASNFLTGFGELGPENVSHPHDSKWNGNIR